MLTLAAGCDDVARQVLYADFTAIVENHVSFVNLLDTARGKGPTGAGVPPLVSMPSTGCDRGRRTDATVGPTALKLEVHPGRRGRRLDAARPPGSD